MKKRKNKSMWIGGIVGGLIGLFIFFSNASFKFEWFEYFFKFIFKINILITGCKIHCYYMYLVYLIIIMLLCASIGVLLTLIINKIKKII